MKKFLAIFLVAILLLSTFAACGRRTAATAEAVAPPNISETEAASRAFSPLANSQGETVALTSFADHDFAEESLIPRDGYVLAPTMFGATGIDSLSSFFLRTPTGYDAAPALSIDGQPPMEITREDATTFLATPAIPLLPNSIYIFRLAREGHADITWAFQTTVRFELMSTLPRHESTNVPVATGIEFVFSHSGETNIEDFFSIYPNVPGRFIHRDNTAVFMPTNPLRHGQIYTVTLAEGVSQNDSERIGQRVFSFETEPESTEEQPWPAVRLHFSQRHVEFPTFEPASVNFWVHHDRELRLLNPSMDITVHRIDDRDYAVSAVNRLMDFPHWSIFAHNVQDRLVDTSRLTQVYSATFRGTANQGWWHWDGRYTLTETLSAGFYVLTGTTEGAANQVIIQITDIAVQIIADDNMTIAWINDMNTGRPAANATVYDPRDSNTSTASNYGIAIIDRGMQAGSDYFIITANGMESVVFAHGTAFHPFARGRMWSPWDSWGHSMTVSDLYWTILQLDRTLFQRDDTLNLWGLVQNRRQNENIAHVTAVITENNWWWGGGGQDTLVRQNIPVVDGAYSGAIRLPHLDTGSYQLTIYHGDVVLSNIFFSVRDYVKPPYQLLVSASHAAIFAGEEVTFTARTEFFEGTPVAELSISHDFWGWELNTPSRGTTTTDADGNFTISARPTAANASVQGQRSITFAADATLPEIGWVHREEMVTVFVNDIDVSARATQADGNATLNVNVHNITLDRINDGTAAFWGDFLCDPVVGQRLNVHIYRIYWVPIRIGERYCFATRQVVPRYRYDRREERLQSFDMVTDSEGYATRDFTIPNRQRESYEARVSTTDGNGRRIIHYVFVGRDWSNFHWNAERDDLFLYGAEESYNIGDMVELTVMQGTEAVTRGNFLFVVVAGGILSYHVGTNPLTFEFADNHVPNAQVFAYHFNGHVYTSGWDMSRRLVFNRETRGLQLEIVTDQGEYRPSDTATVTINVTDLAGNPVAAHVNISLVDEALFALMDYNVDTLASLYSSINDSLRVSLATHQTFASDGIREEAEYSADFRMGAMADMAMSASDPAAAPVAESQAWAGGADDTHIRERFEDTAVFTSLTTNANGTATFTFQLPDNITSWRVTASAVSNDLYAGNSVESIRVTNPMFVHYTLNNIFLVGDTPTLGVNAFGTALSGGETVTFEVWRESAPTDIRRATGVSFERIDIPLWPMESDDAIIIRASVAGFSDAILHPFRVVESHRMVDTAVFYAVTTNTVFDTNQTGLTNITFTDHGRGQFLHNLMGMRWARGARIEGLVTRREATSLIQTHFPDVTLWGDTTSDFDPREYQQPDGGLAMLPYASSNLQTTVALMPFILDEINRASLRNYLELAFISDNMNNRMLALYGLALLGEPVLLDLQRFATVENLSVRNTAYVALGLMALGERQAALDLYNLRIAPYIQRIAPYYRVNTGEALRQIQDATSVVALLAAQLGLPEALGLHHYAARRHTDNLTLNLERLAFISYEIENHTATPASITYTLFGETVTRDLSQGRSFNLRIPAQNMHEFNLVSVTGQVGAVSIVRTPLEDVEAVENDIVITRQFFRAGSSVPTTTFQQDELIRVQITVDYSRRDMYGSYVITDFLPAGLVHVENSARFGPRDTRPNNHRWAHVRTEGQRITFFDYNGRFDRRITYFYYARVVNPGTFTAQGTMVQSIGAREYMAVGQCVVITIR